ncbi:MAG: glucosaminidase domain-containing protein [Actinobacteria bacterium]|nr:glucosaminidase domain-containing protein [Actinomycetota bacterium]
MGEGAGSVASGRCGRTRRGAARVRASAVCALVPVVLAVLLAAVTSGAVAPVAAAAPDAAGLDAFLAQHASPMTGTGATFIREGQEHGVNPVFLVAIAGAETSFGAYLYSENGDQCTYNAFNWFYGPTWPTSDFSSWDEAIARVAEGLAGRLYYGDGLYSVDAIAPRYCPDGTAQWIANVKAFMSELGGYWNDTRIAVSAGMVPSAMPPPTEPGLVELNGSVKLDRGDREVGQRIYAWFTLTNSGGQPLDLEGVRLAIRGPGRLVRDLVSDQPVTLGPGQSLEVSSSWPLDLAGRWHGWIEVTQGGEASLVGDEQAFGFWVKLPEDQVLHRWERRDATLSRSL